LFSFVPPAIALVLLVGCSSAPPEAPQPAAAQPEVTEPQPSLARRSAEAPELSPAHEPFIRMVDISRLQVGMTQEEVLQVFPDPERVEISPRDREVWRYDFAELHFQGNRLEDWFNLPGSGM
jgi:hypothetical protein